MANNGAFYTGVYRNVFAEMGYDPAEIDRRVEETFNEMFYGPKNIALYHPDWDDKASFEDTGNVDARTEGMSYAMMMCVQMDKQEEFDKLWNFSKTFMFHKEGIYRGYYAWSVALDGHRFAQGPAPDGEEYYAMALLFASNRWGDREPPYDYGTQARAILHECVHKGENGEEGDPMWTPDSKLIKFVPEADYTDPSYHLPHFYDLFGEWADEADRPFWKAAAKASREYLHKACHPETGLSAECTLFDGSFLPPPRGREKYYSDAYRVPANISMDSLWFDADPWQYEINGKLEKYFCENEPEHRYHIYDIDGKIYDQPALHPVAIISTNAEAAIAATKAEGGKYDEYARECVRLFWETPLRRDIRRYYDNCLYMFAMLALSGKYRIWFPAK